jgi:ATP-dependent helicase/nuclease subunit A
LVRQLVFCFCKRILLSGITANYPGVSLRKLVSIHGKLVGAIDTEIEAAVHTVVATLAHPVMRRAASAALTNLRRETPIFLRREDGTLVVGVVDLAFREEAADFEWTVVDFKTDREFELNRAEYTAQVAYYAQAIERATNSSVSGVLLVI